LLGAPTALLLGVNVVKTGGKEMSEGANCDSGPLSGGMGEYKEGDTGYRVTYEDGYVSWSPKEVFDEAYRPTSGINFGLAIEAMKVGHRVCRTGWNGWNMFCYLVEGSMVNPSDLRGNAAKAVEVRDGMTGGGHNPQEITGHIDMMAADGSIVVGWLASQTDMLADDWHII
jgi:hypothetical protein